MKDGTVYLVGAGPGDKGLITVKGLSALRRAQVVLYDKLSNPDLLQEAPKGAELIFVGKVKGHHHLPQEEINALLVARGKEGKRVVRLTGGDPYIFGRGGEEAQALSEAGVPFEVVPGVTAGFAAAAYAGIPVTHRDYTTSVELVTGHENPAKRESNIDWGRLGAGTGTLVFYMGLSNIDHIAGQLIAHGRPPSTPVAIVSRATTTAQQTLVATLCTVAERVREQAVPTPAVIVVGEVVRLREQLQWFDLPPVTGCHLAVASEGDRRGSSAQQLSPPADRNAPGMISRGDILLVAHPGAVDDLREWLENSAKDSRALCGVTVAAIGEGTVLALRSFGIVPDLRFPAGVSDLLEGRLREKTANGGRVYLVGGDAELFARFAACGIPALRVPAHPIESLPGTVDDPEVLLCSGV